MCRQILPQRLRLQRTVKNTYPSGHPVIQKFFAAIKIRKLERRQQKAVKEKQGLLKEVENPAELKILDCLMAVSRSFGIFSWNGNGETG